VIVRAGTSGYAHKEWKGAFYPAELGEDEMLAFYAARLGTVEINNTFYRIPRPAVLERWAAAVPTSFVFVLKASQRITHRARLLPDAVGDSVDYLWKVAASLGDRLGPIFFQTPPALKCDLDRLHAFLDLLPAGMRAAFEFRHPSWFDEPVYQALRDHGAVLCSAETDDDPGPGIVVTSDWGYLRLRKEQYTDAELEAWNQRVHAAPWREAFLFFKHDEGNAPVTAQRFSELARG
jgi:uncharacterized protein YecE (DUF72 family)